MSVRVKICGVTCVADAVRAAMLGADAIGLNFWPQSKRCVGVEAAREIVRALPPFVAAVGVFVDQGADEVRRIAAEAGLTAVQLHGAEDPATCAGLPLPVYKAFRCGGRTDTAGPPWVDEVDAYADQVEGVVLDAAAPGYGGTGHACDWALARAVAERFPVVLAGGLTPATVAAAIAAVRPWAVDVASGVESSPRAKDPELMARFIQAVKETRT